jgi:hypothetical protein
VQRHALCWQNIAWGTGKRTGTPVCYVRGHFPLRVKIVHPRNHSANLNVSWSLPPGLTQVC